MTDKRHILIWCTLALPAMLAAAGAVALPEDAEQPIHGTYDNSLLLLDEGKQVFYGSEGVPARISQGTLVISGQEITIERRDGEIRKVTVIGNPAHYEQQPAAGQAVVTAHAATISLDYDTQHVSADGNVRFSQGNDLWTGCHIDYFIESKRITTPKCENGVQAKAILTPRNNNGQ